MFSLRALHSALEVGAARRVLSSTPLLAAAGAGGVAASSVVFSGAIPSSSSTSSVRYFTSSTTPTYFASSSKATASSSKTAPAESTVHTSEESSGPVQDASVLFDVVWRDLLATRGLQGLVFPRQIVWLTGAPGAGKGTMASIVMKERDIAASFEVSSLLDSPMFREMKSKGLLIDDQAVWQATLVELLRPEYSNGVIVDGFPRTTLQAHCIRLLRDKMRDLWTEHHKNPQLRDMMRRPTFTLACFYCSEEESIKRQLARGRELARLNRMVSDTGVGNVADVRATDVSPEAARKRYLIFKNDVFESLQAIKSELPFHVINADGTVEQVKKQLLQEFAYQSANDLGEEAFEMVRGIEPASIITKQARTHLCTRLNSYADDFPELFKSVLEMLSAEFMHIIRRQALAGKAIIRSNNVLFENHVCVNMVLDVLAERGYTCVLDVQRVQIPVRVDPVVIGDTTGPRIVCRSEKTFVFTIEFPKPEIRRSE